MLHRSVEVSDNIPNTPEAVLRFIADVRNRTQYVSALKSVSDIQGDPFTVGNSWNWTFEALGKEFQGTARCTQYEPGQIYAFRTEGGLESTWTYRAQPEGKGSKLTVHVEYTVPDNVQAHLPPNGDLGAMEQKEAARMFAQLKAIFANAAPGSLS